MRNISYLFFLLVLTAGFFAPGSTFAQRRNTLKQVPSADKARLTVGTVSFLLPKNLEIKDAGKTDSIFLAFDTKENYGIFLSVPPKNTNHITFMADTYEKGLKLFFAQENIFDWKESSMYYNAQFSKYETEHFALSGIGKIKRSALNGRVIKFKEKEFFIGYLLLADASKVGPDDMQELDAACETTLKIIRSITGERARKGENLCSAFLIETAQL